MKVLIVYSKGVEELRNRKSALGSYIRVLAGVLEEGLGAKVWVNDVPISQIHPKEGENDEPSSSFRKKLINKVKKNVPKSIKQKRFEKSLIIQQKLLLDQLLNSKNEYDHILEFYTMGSELGEQLSRAKNIPLHIVYDSPVIEQEEFFKETKVIHQKIFSAFEEKSLKHAKSVVVYSNPVKEFLLNQNALNENQFYIHQNVDFSRLDFESTKKDLNGNIKICFLGSFLKWHNVDQLVYAFEELYENNQKIELHLLGKGLEWEQIKKQVENSPAQDKIFMPGFIDGEALKNYKEKMHIGVMPGSNWYGAPNKIFEYGAAGMAVVSCKSPTICDLFDEKEVVFFEMNNLKSMTKSIDLLITDNSKLLDYMNSLSQKVKSDYNEKSTLDFYKSILTN